ncbi:MAG: type II toxin-antitoxin system RelE/ParE family toxin [Paludibacteraceae bacterium]|nr:type II toxin-antitoxin system RelE/ParE family toxin [Paludibacteraceae bacterium]
MKVIWSDTAKLHWSKTLDFIAKNFGVSAVETFIKKTMEATKQISAMP